MPDRFKHPFFWLVLGVAGLICSGLFLVLMIPGASLACVRCNCTYSLFAQNPDCRWPAVWGLLFDVSLGIGVLGFLIATILWFRQRAVRRGPAG